MRGLRAYENNIFSSLYIVNSSPTFDPFRRLSTLFAPGTMVLSLLEVRLVSEEYILLFNTITDALETLDALRKQLMEAQQKAEEIYISR